MPVLRKTPQKMAFLSDGWRRYNRKYCVCAPFLGAAREE